MELPHFAHSKLSTFPRVFREAGDKPVDRFGARVARRLRLPGMRAFVRTRAFLALLTVLLALLAVESLLTHNTLAGIVLLLAGLVCGWRTVAWRRPG